MKKFLKIVVIFVIVSFGAIQFYRPERTSPPTNSAETLEASTDLPQNVRDIFKRSCNDCHTNETNWIWYSNIAPISWGMVDHVNEGREELNFSKWATYNADRQDHKLEEICEVVENGEMPFYQYIWLHWDAALSADDIKTLCQWAKAEQEKLKLSANIE